ncbi:hypothetical protein HQ560_04095 [bacterium]|nr:hypothetical protein [bacterium]
MDKTNLHPPGPAWRAAEEFGCDMSLIEENLRLTPAERIRRFCEVVKTLSMLQHAMESGDVDELGGLLGLLIQHDVSFVIIGETAASAYGARGGDVVTQVCCTANDEPHARLASALQGLNPVHRRTPTRIPFDPAAESSRGLKNLYLATDIGQLDCLSFVKGIGGHEDVLAESMEVELNSGPCRILDIPGLIRAKTAMGRPRDHRTIARLRDIQNRIREADSDSAPA